MVGITIGTFQMVYSYSNQFFQPIQTITNSLNQIESIFTSSERVQLVLNQEIEIVDKENPIEVDHFQGKVEFRNVTFSYEKGNPAKTILSPLPIIPSFLTLSSRIGTLAADIFPHSSRLVGNLSIG